ncbi:MAG: MATE family efflux transporter [Tissierellia bacterium]|nr:MATE family efflux transporter [Tissierellia bacterium]
MFFQQLYNMVDSMIVGRYVGENALAAVGVSFPVLMIFMAIAVGINIGASVIISQYYGATKYRRVKTAALTAIISMTVISLLLMAIGLLGSKQVLIWLNTPSEVFTDGEIYLRITILGLLFLFLYNIATGVFAALGDSKTPLYLLICSSLSNIALDIFMVKTLNMGVAGAAWATFICQGLASISAMVILLRRLWKLEPRRVQFFSGSMLKRIAKVAIPSVLQQSFISVGNLIIQGLVNSYGPDVMAAYSAAIKLNTFSVMTLTTVANGVSGFAAQNKGAGNIERIHQGFKNAIVMALIMASFFIVLYGVFTSAAMSIFLPENNHNPAVMSEGIRFLRLIAPFYAVVVFKLIPDGVMRGTGAMRAFMISTFTDLILRVVLSFVFSKGLSLGSFGIWLSWPVGWTMGMIVAMWFYKRGQWEKVDMIRE